jgi:hypothetical protein
VLVGDGLNGVALAGDGVGAVVLQHYALSDIS